MEAQSKIISSLQGSVLAIGLSEELGDLLRLNEQVTNLYFVDVYQKNKSKEKGKKKREKRFSIKKMRKRLGHHTFDTIFCDIGAVHSYLKTWIRDSIYVGKQTILLYGVPEIDWDKLKSRYARYGVMITTIEESTSQVFLKLELNQAKNNRFKEFFYYLIDSFIDLIDFITDLILR